MDIITSLDESKEEIIGCIEKNGISSEHNYWYFRNQQTNYIKPYFFKFDNSCGIMSVRYKSGIWEMIGEALAPQEKRLELFERFLDYILISKKDKKVFTSVQENRVDAVHNMLKRSTKYKGTKPPLLSYAPIFNLKKWDENLNGKKWKKLRNIKNKLLKTHIVEILPSREIDKKKLSDIVLRWKKCRNKVNKNQNPQMYINFINYDFEGTDMMRTIIINGEPCSITAGWSIPNSNNYHSAIGLHNYKYDGLGELSNLDELEQLKKKKYEYADFGQSNKSLLQFKKKFGPDDIYTIYGFYILKI
ncbi:MAG: phosphatidylglycerol lysyltransferase domain-containing protein [Nanoarchaeota archaeon]